MDGCVRVILDESSSLHVLENKNIGRNCSEPMQQCGLNDEESMKEEKLKQNISSKKLNHEMHH